MEIKQNPVCQAAHHLEAAFGTPGLDSGGNDATHQEHDEEHCGRHSKTIPHSESQRESAFMAKATFRSRRLA